VKQIAIEMEMHKTIGLVVELMHSIQVVAEERRGDVGTVKIEVLLWIESTFYSIARGRHACSAPDTIHTIRATPTHRYLHNHFNAACRLSRTYHY
jgi:hypothetical protein